MLTIITHLNLITWENVKKKKKGYELAWECVGKLQFIKKMETKFAS